MMQLSRTVSLILWLSAWLIWRPAIAQESSAEIDIRGTFMLHIVNYTLDENNNNKTFCLMESNERPYQTFLLQKQQAGIYTDTLTISPISKVDEAVEKQCDYLFVAEEFESPELFQQIREINDRVMTIGESFDFVNKAGVLSLVERAQKIKILIQRDRYRSCPIKFSARLLKYANFTG